MISLNIYQSIQISIYIYVFLHFTHLRIQRIICVYRQSGKLMLQELISRDVQIHAYKKMLSLMKFLCKKIHVKNVEKFCQQTLSIKNKKKKCYYVANTRAYVVIIRLSGHYITYF